MKRVLLDEIKERFCAGKAICDKKGFVGCIKLLWLKH